MKTKVLVSALFTLLMLMLTAIPTFGQETAADTDIPGFGLQAEIFRNVRNLKTDFSINFSSLRDYQLTPGDRFTLTVSPGIFDSGNAQSTARAITYAVQLQEDYTLDVPILGVVNVAGMKLPDVQKQIASEIKQAMTAQYAAFILTAPAQFNVFIYGGVARPGQIIATPLVTLVDAIAMASGFKPGASYRTIQLRRDGKVITLDIAKYYEEADFSANPRLQPGDSVYVPAAEIIGVVAGKAKYPGTYELLPGDSLNTLLKLAGGPMPGSKLSEIEVSRLDNNGIRRIQQVDYDEAESFIIDNGDAVTIRAGVENPSTVSIEGAVYGKRIAGNVPVAVPTRPVRIDFPFYPGISVLDLLDGVGGPTPYALLQTSIVERSDSGERVLIDMNSVWTNRERKSDIDLRPGDVVLIPMQKLSVFITGSVNDPGAVPYTRGNTVADYILLAGGIDDNIANPRALFEIDADGNRHRLEPTSEPGPGAVLYIGKRPLFQTDQQVSNALIAAGWITSIIVIITQVWEFLDLVGVLGG